MNAYEAWDVVIRQLEMEMPRASFDTWVRDTEPLFVEDGVITVAARNQYVCDWLESRLQSTVKRLLVGIWNEPMDVRFVVRDAHYVEPEFGEEEEDLKDEVVTVEPVQWLDYDRIVQPHKQVVVKGYLRRLGMELGPKAIWLYVGFHQAAWKSHANGHGSVLHSQDVIRFSGLSSGAFWRLMRQEDVQEQLQGLVVRIDPPNERRYHRGRDGRPHRSPVRYQVCMTPRLTRADACAVRAHLKQLIQTGLTLADALQNLIRGGDIVELLSVAEQELGDVPGNTVMEIVRLQASCCYTPEVDRLAQELHRRIINSLGDIHIPHYFITETIHHYNLTPAQSWLITVARDMAYLNARTGERREVVTFKGGYQEMAELVGSGRYKTVQAWFHPQWVKQKRGGEMTRFLVEEDMQQTGYVDLRVGSMARCFRVLLDEPLDANGGNRVDANGSDSRTRMEALVDASGTNMVDANGTALNTLKHPLNTHGKNTSSTQPEEAVAAAPTSWELKTLLQQNHVHLKVQRELLKAQVPALAFVAWILFASSIQARQLSDPLGYAISQLRSDPSNKPQKRFQSFASLPPAELMLLMDSDPSPVQHPLAQAWKKRMGSPNPRLADARTILFGESEMD